MRCVVMGVSGTGKSAIGTRLAKRLDIPYVEGDDLHPPENIARMQAGIPLTDQDRRGWLLALRDRIRRAREEGHDLVLTCSALKRSYRDLLRQGDPGLIFVYLEGDRALIEKRMRQRSGHFMPVTLLDSQLRDLEPPQPDERAIRVDIEDAPEVLVERVLRALE